MTEPFRPSDDDIRAYLDGEHGPPHPEVVAIIQDDLLRAALAPADNDGEARNG